MSFPNRLRLYAKAARFSFFMPSRRLFYEKKVLFSLKVEEFKALTYTESSFSPYWPLNFWTSQLWSFIIELTSPGLFFPIRRVEENNPGLGKANRQFVKHVCHDLTFHPIFGPLCAYIYVISFPKKRFILSHDALLLLISSRLEREGLLAPTLHTIHAPSVWTGRAGLYAASRCQRWMLVSFSAAPHVNGVKAWDEQVFTLKTSDFQ